MPLRITALYLSFFAFFYVGLTLNVIRNRYRHRVSLGDGGEAALTRVIRAHGNFSEYTPFIMLMIAVLEFAGRGFFVLHALCLSFLIGRLAHAYALLNVNGPSFLRKVGMTLTFVPLLAAGVSLLGIFTRSW